MWCCLEWCWLGMPASESCASCFSGLCSSDVRALKTLASVDRLELGVWFVGGRCLCCASERGCDAKLPWQCPCPVSYTHLTLPTILLV
eukprot:8995762-Pyramimonas_sp.AAC.1